MPGNHRGTGFRVDRGDLRDFIRVDPEFITNRFLDAVIASAEGATVVMETRVRTADTKTGLDEGRRGRVKTGAMIESLRGPGGGPVTIVQRETATGRASVSFGFQNNAPDYTRFQEQGTKHIEAMLAHQEGMNYFLEHVVDEMAAAAEDVGNYMLGARFATRAYKFGRG